MAIEIEFPDPHMAEEDGLVFIGGDVTPRNLYNAYLKGIFPWPVKEDFPVTWCSPDPRGILFLDEVHYSKSLLKLVRNNPYRITKNRAFEQVIELCAQTRVDNTWIVPEIIKGYIDFHKEGKAYSVECWEGEDLVGGLYGVCIDRFYSGESMFNLKDNTSKLCLHYFLEELRLKNIEWYDIQMVTPLSESFGGKEIPRKDFLRMLPSVIKS